MNTHNDSSSFICLAVLFQKKKALPASMCVNAGHAFSFKHMKRGFWVKIWSSSLTVASICMSFSFRCFIYGNILSCWNYMRIKGQCQRDGRNINDTLMPEGFQNGRICMRNGVKMVGYMRAFGVFENFISYCFLPCY